jgi:hypothetical protein
MAMSKMIQKEVRKSRELLWLLLDGKKCCFCKELLLEEPGIEIRFGNATAPAMELDITLHHDDGNHANNGSFGNRKNILLSHETCHKSHHAQEVFRAFRGVVGIRGKRAA